MENINNEMLDEPTRKAALCALLEQHSQLIASIGQHKNQADKLNKESAIQKLLNKVFFLFKKISYIYFFRIIEILFSSQYLLLKVSIFYNKFYLFTDLYRIDFISQPPFKTNFSARNFFFVPVHIFILLCCVVINSKILL